MAADYENNLLYLGGAFNGFYPQFNDFYGSFVDLEVGTPDTSFANPNNYVYASTPDGEGGIFIGGSFNNVGDSVRNYIAHINAQGIVSSWNAGIDSTNSLTKVNTILLVGNTVYVGGVFSSIQGQTRYNLAAFDKTTGQLLSWEPVNSSMVLVLAENNGFIFAGGWGTFSSPFTTASNSAAKLNPITGAIENWYPQINNGSVKSFAFSGDSVFVGGNFQAVNGQLRTGLASISLLNGSLKPWNPILNTTFNTPDVVSLLTDNNRIYVGGIFEGINGDWDKKYVSSFDLNSGNTSIGFDPVFDSYPYTMLIIDTALIIGGTFSITNNTFQPHLIKVHASTGETIDWEVGIGSHVYTLTSLNTRVFVGGAQEMSEIKYRNLLTAFDVTIGKPNSFKCLPLGGDTIHKILIQDSLLFFGGTFSYVDGAERSNLASYNVSSNSLSTWNPNVNGTIRSMMINENQLFIAGDFTEVSGQERNHLASFELSTGELTEWNPNVNGSIYEVAKTGNFLSIGGQFDLIGSVTRSNLARFSLNSLILDDWAPNVDNTVRTICEYGDDILIGGDFNFIDTAFRSYFASVKHSTGAINPLNFNFNGRINKIKSINNHIYLAGAFTVIDGQIREQIAEVNIDSAIITSWNPQSQFIYEAKDICALNSEIFFSGDNDIYAIQENGLLKTLAPNLEPSSFDLSVSTYSFPSGLDQCTGKVYINAYGTPTFSFTIDSDQEIGSSNGFISFDSLCPGIHQLTVFDHYQDSINCYFVIPTPESTLSPVGTDLSTIIDLLGQTEENCSIDFSTIDTVFISSSTYHNDTLTVVWTIEDASGTYNSSVHYYLDDSNYNGNYFLQYNFYCQSSGEVFSTTEIFLFNGSSLNLEEDLAMSEDKVYIFPNPTYQTLTIKTNGIPYNLIVRDTQGKYIFEKIISDKATIDTTDFLKGIYFFNFVSATNQIIKKVVKL